jgi:hypothetical protein
MPTPFTLAADDPLHRLARAARGAGLAGLAVSALGAVLDPTQLLRSWLVAWVFLTGTALGCLALLMIAHLTGGAWGAAIRRLLESGAGTLPLLALAFVPLALGVPHVWAWATPEAAHDHLLQEKALYLNVPFFLARAAVYFAAWIAVARTLVRWSTAQDERTDPAPRERMELWSRGGLVLLGLTMTFAAFDWLMSLEPRWFSTMYGVLFMGGSVVAALAFVIPVLAALAHRPLATVVTAHEFHDLGKLLLAFVLLWAYFGFSQFLIIWSGNLPEETGWYLHRLGGGWQWVAGALVVLHFALPFALLLSRDLKRDARRLAALAATLWLVRWVDVWWLVAPAFHPGDLALHWLDLATAVGLGGLWVAHFVRRLAARPLVPLHDPWLRVEAAT